MLEDHVTESFGKLDDTLDITLCHLSVVQDSPLK